MTGLVAALGASVFVPSNAGLYANKYTGYSNGVPGWFLPYTPFSSGVDLSPLSFSGNFTAQSWEWIGYWKATSTSIHQFNLYGNEGAQIWIGNHAIDEYKDTDQTSPNAVSFKTNVYFTYTMQAGIYYPMRIQWWTQPESYRVCEYYNGQAYCYNEIDYFGQMTFQWRPVQNTGSYTNDVSKNIFYNPATNGF